MITDAELIYLFKGKNFSRLWDLLTELQDSELQRLARTTPCIRVGRYASDILRHRQSHLQQRLA
ncbi:MAG: hypothetical protein OXG15_12615 [Gammaproteobacteria bacterium]|nr:hypothetical protein [Gammaproteobacteria bacterium]